MLDSEYRRRLDTRRNKRNWTLTVLMALAFLAVAIGMIFSWRHFQHNAFLWCAIMVPAGITALIFLGAAINGRAVVVKEAVSGVLTLFIWWP